MPCSITCSTKIPILAIAQFSFIFVGIICEFAMVPGVYILLYPQKEEVYYSHEGTDVHIQQHIHQKGLNICLTSFYYAKIVVELENSQTRNSAVIVLQCL